MIPIGCETCPSLARVIDMLRDRDRRAKLATRYLKTVSSGQFVTAALVEAAIRTLSGESLPLPAKPRAKWKPKPWCGKCHGAHYDVDCPTYKARAKAWKGKARR